jgi:hypothetical protein
MAIAIRTQYFRNTTFETETASRRIWNWLDPSVTNKLRTITKFKIHVYQGEHLENLADAYYGDISYNWILQMYNGITNYLDIKEGTKLKIPDPVEVDNMLALMRKKKAQQVVIENDRKGQLVRI